MEGWDEILGYLYISQCLGNSVVLFFHFIGTCITYIGGWEVKHDLSHITSHLGTFITGSLCNIYFYRHPEGTRRKASC